ncbi:pur operon repressor [Caldibacillus debilis]|jgi:purine operon repressor|uniref:Purine operon repressor, PurR n=1 Tax=Caldibacillus debilis GB1 TaxID=1339248 RepID=A0A420VIU6_9BACI|nr:pur operon repressor [Caldibacillus debilis]MBO2481500.1 pur operon repressor [Bacillaceae bacterium]MBY6271172.1 pur operon repressor [Bacillaceae bacterium]OUM92785.1 MAG: pur operon repressor [Caldibacillus debilis]REJ23761.1 MAG: pur operon repressor [Caldibacillus debilis]RKO63283.1 purine operon repressor, PurR [Caldibacillus debilis GB1]
MSWKRSERLVDMTHYLLNHPREIIPLSFFTERYQAAKSSISEDLAIVKEIFSRKGIGDLMTIPGAAGGVRFFVSVKEEDVKLFVKELLAMIGRPDRLLPGGYLYMADIVGNPKIMDKVGQLFAAKFGRADIDAVMTVATKGIPLAFATARYLSVPVVIVRRDSKITEGSTVSINYVSGSAKRIQTMVLSKKSLKEGSRVLIVDDFMKAGGTINGMISLLKEFQATYAGICVLAEVENVKERLVDQYLSVIKITKIDEKNKKIEVEEGNFFQFGE